MFDWINWSEWTEEPLVIKIHAMLAVVGLVAGAIAFTARRGSARHKKLGRVFGIAALATAATGFGIHEIRVWGPWSPIHLLSILTIIVVVLGVGAARAGRITAHSRYMVYIYLAGFVISGAITLTPGRMPAEVFLQRPARTLLGSEDVLFLLPVLAVLLSLWIIRGDLIRLVLWRPWGSRRRSGVKTITSEN